MKGIITSFQRMSIHDGPGIRTAVFLKGCNMRCKWCHNPETWNPKGQIQYIRSKCIGCGVCACVCPDNVISFENDRMHVDFARCLGCGTCADNCCTGALSIVGREVSPTSLWDEIKIDLPYFKNSGGGVTVSGGEPLLQKDFVKAFLEICKKNGVGTAIETNLSLDWELIEDMIPYVDLWMCDFKLFDPKKHREWTGIGNERIKDNIICLAEKGCRTVVRTPVIPGVNDDEEEIRDISNFLSKYPIEYELLGFHTLGFNKYESLGIQNELRDLEPLSKERLEALKVYVNNIR